jgi:hypothetical protein
MSDDQQDKEPGGAELKRNVLVFAVSLLVVLGLGWGLTVLFGYYWILVDFEAAPTWSVMTAFIAMPIASVVIGFAVGDGSVIETGIKIVIVGVSLWVLWGRPWLDPILLATLCGLVAIALVAFVGRKFDVEIGSGKEARLQDKDTARQPGKADRRTRDDELRLQKNERDRRIYEAKTAFTDDEKPAED